MAMKVLTVCMLEQSRCGDVNHNYYKHIANQNTTRHRWQILRAIGGVGFLSENPLDCIITHKSATN